jgi:hypothetical protein
VNAAYLMLTTAWMAGADPAPVAAAPAAAPVVSTSMGACNGGGYVGGYGGCGGISNDCCDSGRQRLCDRIKGMFKRRGNDCCDAAPTCAPAPVVHHAPAPVANCGCEDTCKRERLCDRLKGMFKRRGNDCCDTGAQCGCNGIGGIGTYGTPGIIGGTAEPIPVQPKPAGGAPMPSKPTSTTPITMSGVITNVTPVAAPASPF